MIDNIEAPAATATVTWFAPDEGGRSSGPPSGAVYAANCAFPLGGEPETIPGWPATAEKFSLLLQKIEERADRSWLCKVDFFAPDLVAAYLSRGAQMLVMEGPKVVGDATIEEVFLDLDDGDGV